MAFISNTVGQLVILCGACVCSKISELLEETERLHEQVLSRQYEIKSVLSSLNLFHSRADAVSVKLTAFKENVCEHALKPLSADVSAIKADLQLIKVLELVFLCHFLDVCWRLNNKVGAILSLV